MLDAIILNSELLLPFRWCGSYVQNWQLPPWLCEADPMSPTARAQQVEVMIDISVIKRDGRMNRLLWTSAILDFRPWVKNFFASLYREWATRQVAYPTDQK